MSIEDQTSVEKQVSALDHAKLIMDYTLLFPIRYAKSRQLRQETGKEGLTSAMINTVLDATPIVAASGWFVDNPILMYGGLVATAVAAGSVAGTYWSTFRCRQYLAKA